MPDWSYRTVLRPLMLALGPERSRRLATATLRTLSRIPGGLKAIDFLGHMRPDERLRTFLRHPERSEGPGRADRATHAAGSLADARDDMVEVASPISLGPLIDPRGDALHAFARFGVGLIEVGPVAEQGNDARPRWTVNLETGSIDADEQIVVGVDEVLTNIVDAPVPVVVHIAKQDGAAVRRIVSRLKDHAAMFVVDEANVEDAAGERVVVTRDRLVNAGSPHEVKRLLDGGASFVSIDAGLVVSGPGLIKRCNEALECGSSTAVLKAAAEPPHSKAWFWATVLGTSMFLGGLMAVLIASTRVVLPYDESLCGLTRSQMATLNPRLLPFMAHDRVTLAGTMISLGIFYFALGRFGVRRGAHWAQVAIIASGASGTISFFSFLGFGYFDPFHAFVTSILTQFLLLVMVLPLSPAQPHVAEWRETAAWRRGQWGQLLFILMGVGLLGAGTIILAIGCTRVFVKEDLEFMRTTAAQLALSYDTLVPLVAHDRASLGGMLIANGLAIWLSAQWGFRAGVKWLWHALAWGGNIAFLCAIAVHVIVGYSDWLHLLPAFLGWLTWNVALGLTRAWLSGAEEAPAVRAGFAAAAGPGSGGSAPR